MKIRAQDVFEMIVEQHASEHERAQRARAERASLAPPSIASAPSRWSRSIPRPGDPSPYN